MNAPPIKPRVRARAKAASGEPRISRQRAWILRTGVIAELEAALGRSSDELGILRTMVGDYQKALRDGKIPTREQAEYWELVHHVAEAVLHHIPRGAKVIVVSRGDPKLLNLGGREAGHFPQQSDGTYAGYHPACSLAAIAQLEGLRGRGAQFLVVPQTSFWWFEYYAQFKRHLDNQYRMLAWQPDTCAIYSLCESPGTGSVKWVDHLRRLVAQFQSRFERLPTILEWHTGLPLDQAFPELTFFSPPNRDDVLPYLDHTVDIVMLGGSASRSRTSEAGRVASTAVVTLLPNGDESRPEAIVEWQTDGGEPSSPPSTSIIIPCTDERRISDNFLQSVLENLPPGFNGKIIVIDDATSGVAAETLKRWGGSDQRVRVVRNRRPAGFAKCCHRGVRLSQGEILIFVSTSVLLLPDALRPLTVLLRDDPGTGAVGGRLLRPDGRLHEAGGMLLSDGSATGFGRFDVDLEAPRYRHVREVDFCSSSLLATRRTLWDTLGGYEVKGLGGDEHVAIDYCLRLRRHGHSVLYQPESAAVYQDWIGAESSGGQAGFTEPGSELFANRWKREFGRQARRPIEFSSAVWQSLAIAGNRRREDDPA